VRKATETTEAITARLGDESEFVRGAVPAVESALKLIRAKVTSRWDHWPDPRLFMDEEHS
jgi:hypothetical protein